MWLTDLSKLADPKYGLTVVFENGWKRRGASGGAQMKAALGVLWHHDVSPRSGTYPLRSMLRDGRKGLSGPLCHIGFDRDGVVHVVGAGKANHAGTGSVPGVVRNGGNTRLIGIEMTSAGTRPWDWTLAQLQQMPKLGAALGDIFGFGSSKHWAHYEYSNGGKIDPAGLPGAMPGLRSRISAVRFTGAPSISIPAADPARPWITSPRVTAYTTAEITSIQTELVGAGYDLGSYGIDGSYGDATGRAVKELQTDLGLASDGVYGPGTEKALMALKDDVAQILKNTGPIKRDGSDVSLRQEIADTKTTVLALREEIDWVRRVAEANQKRIDKAIAQTGPITRGEEAYSLRQELADAKTIGIANADSLDEIERALANADVDTTEVTVPEKAEG